jgi:hypothetical protein
MLFANLVLVLAAWLSPVQMWSASCSIAASSTLVGIGTSLRKHPEDRLFPAIMVVFFVLFAAFALFPFLVSAFE